MIIRSNLYPAWLGSEPGPAASGQAALLTRISEMEMQFGAVSLWGVHSSGFTETVTSSLVNTEQVTCSACQQCPKLGGLCRIEGSSKSSYHWATLNENMQTCSLSSLQVSWGKAATEAGNRKQNVEETAYRESGDSGVKNRNFSVRQTGLSLTSASPAEVPDQVTESQPQFSPICQVGMMIPTSQGLLNNLAMMFHTCSDMTSDNDDFKINLTIYL